MALSSLVNAQDCTFTPEKLWAMSRVGSATASPDGKNIVYNVTKYDVKKNKGNTIIKQYSADNVLPAKLGKGSAPKYINGGKKLLSFMLTRIRRCSFGK